MAAVIGTSNAWTGLAAGLAIEELETQLLLEALFQRFGHDFRAYDRHVLRMRLADAMRAQGAATLSGLQEKVLHDPAASAALLRMLSPQPAALFDDPDHTQRLRTVLAPSLRASPLPRVWIAECAGVGEAWTLAVVLAEEGVLGKLDIHATLANEDLVAQHQDAWLPVADLDAAQSRYAAGGGQAALPSYFDVRDGRARLQPHLRRRITWSQYSLVTDASFNEFQAILCGSALSDFGPVLRQRVLRLFHDSLARFGVLCLDRPLSVSDAYAGTYQAIEGDRPWYKRVG
ncbi:protein-glutamate O-methyltransferase CheR [Massilia sp. Root335]|uniref:CheR family methyltransferase n=1 Tax=Massilia sp. Root335 TaxID=1736517 RepID=UPI0006F72700|nr:CheR family methyltransferase [Massilia sp. Root335]KQV52049.1 chemotaxis protein [Massilia sp. Root335]